MTKRKTIVLSDYQVLAIIEALGRGIPHANKECIDTLRQLLDMSDHVTITLRN